MGKDSWAAIRNERSRVKEGGKLERERAKLDAERRERRKAQLGQFTERLGEDETLDPQITEQVVRAIVEGDVSTHSERMPEIAAERHKLVGRLAAAKTRMANIRERVERAIEQRRRHLDIEQSMNDAGRQSKVLGPRASHRTILVLAALLVVFEGVLLTSPAKNVVRTLFPGLGDVTIPALAGIIVMVTFGAVAVVVSAREIREYRSEADKEVTDEADLKSKKMFAQIWVLTAVAIQFLLMVLRFQVDTGDSSSRGVFVLVSIIAGSLAAVIGLLEYRRYQVKASIPPSHDEAVIDEYMALDAEVRFYIPNELAKLDAEEMELLQSELHQHQRYGAEIGNREVLLAINRLVDKYADRIAESKKSSPNFEALDLGTFLPRPTRHINGNSINGNGDRTNGPSRARHHDVPFDMSEAG